MSRSSHSGSFVSTIRLPTIQRLNLEQIIEFAEAIKHQPLCASQQEEIKHYITNDPAFLEIARLHNKFIDIKENYNLLVGLTSQQSKELQQLVKNTRAFKTLRRTKDISIQDFKVFLTNEKQILPLTQIIEFWSTQCEALKKLDVWENISVMITTESKRSQESEAILRSKLHQLTDIKNDWINQQFFAGYATQQLIIFYTDYICKLESWFIGFLEVKEHPAVKQPRIIHEYVQHLLSQLRELKRHAINSMLARLRCCEFYCDIRHDDLLVYLGDQIKQYCGVSIIKNASDYLPRRSNSLANVTVIIKIIADYLKQNPAENTLLQHYQQLKMRKIPSEWQGMFGDGILHKHIVENPIVLYVENLTPLLLDEYHQSQNLPQIILERDVLNAKDFILNKLRRLNKYIEAERQQLTGKQLDVTDIALEKILIQQTKKYNCILNDISNKLSIEIQREISLLLDDIFSETDVTVKAMTQAINKINNVMLFNKKYLHSDYTHHCDMILQLGHRIQKILAKNQFIMPHEINNVLKLHQVLIPQIKNNDIESLKKILAKLPDTAQKLNEENEAELQHLLIQFLEEPQLNQQGLYTAIARHRHIAAVYGEKWDESFKIMPGMPTEQEHIFLICSYIKNVLIKVLQISPYIDFNNFDNNEMCAALFNIENDYKNDAKHIYIQKNQLEKLKNDFQEKIFNKLNDLFQIKSYLYSHSTQTLDTEKLAGLLVRINKFFTNSEYRTAIHASILKAVHVLLKNYCLSILQQDKQFDKTYIYGLNNLFKENLLVKISQDEEINKTLQTYLETYDGSKSAISSFLTELIPKNNSQADMIIKPYAKKRLDYIKASRDVSQEDYVFFANYESAPGINRLISEAKRFFIPILHEQEHKVWNKNIARLHELFADQTTLNQYRLKKILALLELSHKESEENVSKALKEFDSTINHGRLVENKLIPSNLPVTKDTTFRMFLDEIITKQTWSYGLESITERCGTLLQLQLLHFKLTLHYLTHNLNCTTSWLGKLFKLDDNPIFEKNFFLHFYGPQHIIIICEHLENALLLLHKADIAFGTRDITKSEYKNLTQIITTIKPFAKLYFHYGSNPIAKRTLHNLGHLENKLALHYKLNTVLKRQSSLLMISQENTELHNLILTIIATIKKIENKQILTQEGINQYLTFFDREILVKLNSLLTQPKAEIPFKILYLLANLMLYLTSNNMKLLLLEANKKQIFTNPNWLTLINHFDQSKAVADIIIAINDPLYAEAAKGDFQNVIQFANHLNEVKRQTHQLIKYTLFKEANISASPHNPIKLDRIFKNQKFKNSQYIKLWIVCAEKLQTHHIDAQFKMSYVSFLINFLNKIAQEILLKARDDSSLLNEFIHQLHHVYIIKNRLLEIAADLDKIQTSRQKREFFTDKEELILTIRPLFRVVDQSLALQLLHRLDQFVIRMVNQKQLMQIRKIYTDLIDNKDLIKPQNNIILVKFALGSKNTKDLTKIAAILPIYHLLHQIYTTGDRSSELLQLIDDVIQESAKDPMLKKSSSLPTFLSELKSLALKYFSLKDTRSSLFQKTPSKSHSFFF